jgi:hypothetical protein
MSERGMFSDVTPILVCIGKIAAANSIQYGSGNLAAKHHTCRSVVLETGYSDFSCAISIGAGAIS